MDNNENLELTVSQIEKTAEAILFAAGHPMSYAKLGEVMGQSERDMKLVMQEFATKYNSDENNRGIMMLCFDEECQLCTREEFLPYIREALGIRRGGNLSASSLEVLSVIAYNQPVTRSFIDTVRGVDSSYAVNSLLEKELIEPVGVLDAPGRPRLYGTTDNFLRCFGLSSLSELPEVENLPIAPESNVAKEEQLTIDTEISTEEAPTEE